MLIFFRYVQIVHAVPFTETFYVEFEKSLNWQNKKEIWLQMKCYQTSVTSYAALFVSDTYVRSTKIDAVQISAVSP